MTLQSTTSCFRTFQLTTSRGGRPAGVKGSAGGRYFNSRPHEEVDNGYPTESLAAFQISTHDLTRRSTFTGRTNNNYMEISTHDLTRRSTRFQIHMERAWNISTHDLTRRSTAIFTQKVFLSKSLFVLIAYNIFILH